VAEAAELVDFFGWNGGCVTTRERVALALDELSAESIGWRIDPEDGRLLRRGGSTIYIDTVNASNVEQSGILEAI